MKRIIMTSLALALLIVALPAQMGAHQHRAMPEKGEMKGMHEMAACMEELKLTDAQKQKFETARSTFEKQQNTLEAEIKNLRLDVADAMKAENVKRVKELNQQITTKQLQMKNARVDLWASHMKELSPEQKEIMKKHMAKMGGMMGGKGQFHSARGHKGGHGMGGCMSSQDDCEDCGGERQYKNRK
ncbi:MAG: Spy/CpxP family protein refolding chaperone [Candidatus Cloacimonetes bacterium]|nr:Spy/CpxP family protein refolding chaperone [Candidatus Cloacimonadota bacterium]